MGTVPILAFSRTHWSNSTSSQSICSDGGFCPHHQRVCGCASPLCQVHSSHPRRNSAFLLAPNSCRSCSFAEGISSCRVMLPSAGRQHKPAPASSASAGRHQGSLSLTVQQRLEQWEHWCRLLASVVLCCVAVLRLGLDNRGVKSPVAALHSCSVIIIPSKAAPACDQR